VQHALDDTALLISQSGPESTIDRVHTALHGPLRFLRDAAQIAYAPDATVTHQDRADGTSFATGLPCGSGSILRPLATVIDELNAARNNGSLSHPNDQLLDPAEASLAVDDARTILRYLDNRLQLPTSSTPPSPES
jgi:hypothetical protein